MRLPSLCRGHHNVCCNHSWTSTYNQIANPVHAAQEQGEERINELTLQNRIFRLLNRSSFSILAKATPCGAAAAAASCEGPIKSQSRVLFAGTAEHGPVGDKIVS